MCSGTQESDQVIRKTFKCRFPVNYDGAPNTCHLDSWTPPMIPPTHRKRRLAARIADPDNVSWPALKQRRLAFKQHGGTNGADVDNFNTQPSARGSTHLSYEHLEAVKSSDDDVLSELSTLSGSEGDVTDVMNEFVQKKGEKWKREGSVVAVTETETPEQELGSFHSRIISSCEG